MKKSFSDNFTLNDSFITNEIIHKFFYIFIFLFWLWIGSQAPYTNDDWNWGIDVGMENFLMARVNSRYAGNLFIVLITRSRIVKTLLFAIFSFAVPYLLSSIYPCKEKKHNLFLFLLANLIFMIMSRFVWQQTYGWLAAFANYVISAAALVWLYIAVKKALMGEKFTKAENCLAFLVSFSAQLFIENLTVFFLGVSLMVLLYAIIKKKPVKSLLVIAIGAVLGTILMFSSPVYGELLDTGSSVNRDLTVWGETSILNMLDKIWFSVNYHLPGMYEVNAFVCIAVLISVSSVLSLYKSYLTSKILLLCNIALSVLFIAYQVGWLPAFFTNSSGNTYLSAIYFLLVIFEIVYLSLISEEKKFFIWQLLVWSSSFLIIAPLFITANSGFRLYYAVIVISFIFIAENYFFYNSKKPISDKTFNFLFVLVAVAVIIGSAYYANIYRNIGMVDREQRSIMAEALATGEDSVVLPPYNEVQASFLWGPMPDSYKVKWFKMFYGFDSSVQISYYEE